jgi:hypothetical protein
MALLRGKLFAGALFAGLLFGGRATPLPPTSLQERPVWVKTRLPDTLAASRIKPIVLVEKDCAVYVGKTCGDHHIVTALGSCAATTKITNATPKQLVQDHFQCGIFPRDVFIITEEIAVVQTTRSESSAWVVEKIKAAQTEPDQIDRSVTCT